MRKLVDYRIVVGLEMIDGQKHVEEEVRRLMTEGWEPHGGVTIDTRPHVGFNSAPVTISQAMVRYED